ncbi:hypothetical protein PPO43_03255 [Saprospira sp. CCB-QB6]|uniref:hypothetical protein n=1 Tax=Saprospira sp. CCB-QB6 TaxID=3023936 RepID=UPI00234BD583|nr:hypothetical protein [Saprospira sp. CCB-QB6]WCL82119.1 hypothetical protein PPO43_03255 [Saprospira sp. CCB-QB6]
MKSPFFLMLALLLTLFSACTGQAPKDIQGNWYLEHVLVDGQKIVVNRANSLRIREEGMSLFWSRNHSRTEVSWSGNTAKTKDYGWMTTSMCCDSELDNQLQGLLGGDFKILRQQKDSLIVQTGKSEWHFSRNRLPLELSESSWLIEEVREKATGDSWQPPLPYRLDFQAEGYRFFLEANSCWQTCEYAEGRILPNETGSCTEACCDAPRTEWLKAMRLDSLTYSLSNNQLRLSSANYELIAQPLRGLQAEAKPLPAEKLKGLRWELDSYSDGMMASVHAMQHIFSFEEGQGAISWKGERCQKDCAFKGQTLSLKSCAAGCCPQSAGEISEQFEGEFQVFSEGDQIVLRKGEVEYKLRPIRDDKF